MAFKVREVVVKRGYGLTQAFPHKARKKYVLWGFVQVMDSMHGFALNVDPDMTYFNMIVPCGIQHKQVTSIEKELGYKVPIQEVEEKIKNHFAQVFGVSLI